MNGILVIDKPENYTSRDVVNIVSRELHTKKVGHTGTLDPMATGVLVLCVGDYTKFVSHLTNHDKEYLVGFRFGRETDTLDVTGEVLQVSDVIPDRDSLEVILSTFLGKQTQEVPIYSAKKINGKKLYEYAREKQSVSLPVQDIEIYDLQLIEYENGEGIFSCHVSKGTYIRSLIRDISHRLGTVGEMTSLRRTKLGEFYLKQSVSLDSFSQGNYLLNDFRSFFNYQVYEAHPKDLYKIYHSNELFLDYESDYVLITYQEQDIALYQKHFERYKPILLFDKEATFL